MCLLTGGEQANVVRGDHLEVGPTIFGFWFVMPPHS